MPTSSSDETPLNALSNATTAGGESEADPQPEEPETLGPPGSGEGTNP